MGRSVWVQAIYGVSLSKSKARLIHQHFKALLGADGINLDDEGNRLFEVQCHQGWTGPNTVAFTADGADDYNNDSEWFDEKGELDTYAFGIQGIDRKDATADPSALALSNYAKWVQPALKAAGIRGNPSWQIVATEG